jgi:mRNA interferase MazF
VKRGEVWLVPLDPTVGSEIQKTRPCLIVSPDELNRLLPTLIVAPLTTGSHPARFRVPVRFRGRDGLILADQIRTIARQRLMTRLGKVNPTAMKSVLMVLGDMFAE